MCIEMKLPQDTDVDIHVPDQVLLPFKQVHVDQTRQALG